jgi:hypothetical protein
MQRFSLLFARNLRLSSGLTELCLLFSPGFSPNGFFSFGAAQKKSVSQESSKILILLDQHKVRVFSHFAFFTLASVSHCLLSRKCVMQSDTCVYAYQCRSVAAAAATNNSGRYSRNYCTVTPGAPACCLLQVGKYRCV